MTNEKKVYQLALSEKVLSLLFALVVFVHPVSSMGQIDTGIHSVEVISESGDVYEYIAYYTDLSVQSEQSSPFLDIDSGSGGEREVVRIDVTGPAGMSRERAGVNVARIAEPISPSNHLFGLTTYTVAGNQWPMADNLDESVLDDLNDDVERRTFYANVIADLVTMAHYKADYASEWFVDTYKAEIHSELAQLGYVGSTEKMFASYLGEISRNEFVANRRKGRDTSLGISGQLFSLAGSASLSAVTSAVSLFNNHLTYQGDQVKAELLSHFMFMFMRYGEMNERLQFLHSELSPRLNDSIFEEAVSDALAILGNPEFFMTPYLLDWQYHWNQSLSVGSLIATATSAVLAKLGVVAGGPASVAVAAVYFSVEASLDSFDYTRVIDKWEHEQAVSAYFSYHLSTIEADYRQALYGSNTSISDYRAFKLAQGLNYFLGLRDVKSGVEAIDWAGQDVSVILRLSKWLVESFDDDTDGYRVWAEAKAWEYAEALAWASEVHHFGAIYENKVRLRLAPSGVSRAYDLEELLVVQPTDTLGNVTGKVYALDGGEVDGHIAFTTGSRDFASELYCAVSPCEFQRNFYLPDVAETNVVIRFKSSEEVEALNVIDVPAKAIGGVDPTDEDSSNLGSSLVVQHVEITSSNLLPGGGDPDDVQIKGYVVDDTGNNPGGTISFEIEGQQYADDLYPGACGSSGQIDYCKGSYFVINDIDRPYYSQQFEISAQSLNGDLQGEVPVFIEGTAGTVDGEGEISITKPVSSTRWRAGTLHFVSYLATGIDPADKLLFRLYRMPGEQYVGKIGADSAGDTSTDWSIPADLPAGNYRIKVFQETQPDMEGWSPVFQIVDDNSPPVVNDLNLVALSGEEIFGVVDAWDINEDPLTYSELDSPLPANTLVQSQDTFSYTAAQNYTGPDSFSIMVSDGQSSAIFQVNVTVISPDTLSDYTLTDDVKPTNSEITHLEAVNDYVFAMADDGILRKYTANGVLVEQVDVGNPANGMDVGEGFVAVVDHSSSADLQLYDTETLSLEWRLENISVDNAMDVAIGEGKVFVAFQNNEPQRIQYVNMYSESSRGGYAADGLYFHGDDDINAVAFSRVPVSGDDIVLFSGGESEEIYQWEEANFQSNTGYEDDDVNWNEDIMDIDAVGDQVYVSGQRGGVARFQSGPRITEVWSKSGVHSNQSIWDIEVYGGEIYTTGNDAKVNILATGTGDVRQTISLPADSKALTKIDQRLFVAAGSRLYWYDRNFAPLGVSSELVTWSDLPQSTVIQVIDLDEGQEHTFEIQTQPNNGIALVNNDGVLLYIPEAGFYGLDSVDVSISDGISLSSHLVEIRVQNRPPALGLQAVPENEGVPSVTIGEVASFLASAEDPEGSETISYEWTIVRVPEGSSASLESGGPNASLYTDVVGVYEVGVVASDGEVQSDMQTREVVASNSTPVVQADPVFASANSSTEGYLYVSDSNVLDTHSFTVVSGPLNGALEVAGDGSFLYTSIEDYVGADAFTVRVEDSAGAPMEIEVTVVVQNTPPISMPAVVELPVSTAHEASLPAYDLNGDALSFLIERAPLHGAFQLTDATTGAYVYTPSPGFEGIDEILFRASDGSAVSSVSPIEFRVGVESSEPEPFQGDINDDGKIDAGDLTLAMRILMGLYEPTVEEQARWDVAPLVNGVPVPDGQNNIADYLILKRKLRGLVQF